LATVYLVLLAPAAERFVKNTAHLTVDDPSEPVLYVGYTDVSLEERFLKHVIGTPAFQGTSPELVTEFSALFPALTKAQAYTAEAFVAEHLRLRGFKVICDAKLHTFATLGETVFVKRSVAEPAWRANTLCFKGGKLECSSTGLLCTTEGIQALARKVDSFKYQNFGNSITGGKFTLNSHGQLIRKLPPPPGFGDRSVFVVRFDGEEPLRHENAIIRSDGDRLFFVGERITGSHLDWDVEEFSGDEFEYLEPRIDEVVHNALLNYVSVHFGEDVE
jgi:hypothetical protein